MRPNFFIVGAPRCATTSLCDYLAQHPDVFFPAEKEPLHFCTDLVRESDAYHGRPRYFRHYREQKRYVALYENAKEKVVGDGSTWYLYSKEAAANIYRFNRDAKIVIVVRNPVDFLHSLHSLLVSNQNEVHGFAKSLSLESVRKKGRMLPRNVTFPSRLYYFDVASFAGQIKRYMEIFGRENVKVIVFEEFIRNTLDVYKELLSFLGLPRFEPKITKKNVNRQMRFPVFRYIKQSQLWELRYLIPGPVWARVKTSMWDIYFKKDKRKPVPEETKNMIMKRIAPDVQELSRITGTDFMGVWGYK